MRKTTMLLLVCAALAGRAQVPCKWTVDLSRAAPANWDCLRGETLELTPSFVSGRGVADLSGVESATLYWQTNGMGSAYWSRPAAVDTDSRPHRLVARWTPEMDVGAASYRYFVGAAAPSGTQYRAHGTIRMRGAPGAEPNTLPLPVQVLDFSKVSVTNAPWGEGGGLSTNDVRAIALTRDEAEAGYTEWKCDPAEYNGRKIAIVWDYIGWKPKAGDETIGETKSGRSNDTEVAWSYWDGVVLPITATRTRLRPTPEQEAAWDAKADASDLDGFISEESDPVFENWKPRRELHADMATNIVWKNVYSNGWVYLVPYSNNLEDAE